MLFEFSHQFIDFCWIFRLIQELFLRLLLVLRHKLQNNGEFLVFTLSLFGLDLLLQLREIFGDVPHILTGLLHVLKLVVDHVDGDLPPAKSVYELKQFATGAHQHLKQKLIELWLQANMSPMNAPHRCGFIVFYVYQYSFKTLQTRVVKLNDGGTSQLYNFFVFLA